MLITMAISVCLLDSLSISVCGLRIFGKAQQPIHSTQKDMGSLRFNKKITEAMCIILPRTTQFCVGPSISNLAANTENSPEKKIDIVFQ